MSAYYNEIDPYCCAGLRNLIAEGLIAPGDVDSRDIADVRPDDLKGYTQCHFFAGLGGWSYALRLAGWDDARPVWTGSCPCQPFSTAGKRKGFSDDRHLWPYWVRLIEVGRPATIFGEQVASATQWLRLVRGDLEALAYAVGAMPIEAASAGADHLRDRYWFVADTDEPCPDQERQQRSGQQRGVGGYQEARNGGDVVDSLCEQERRGNPGEFQGASKETQREGAQRQRCGDTSSDRSEGSSWAIGADGKARRVKPGIRLLAHGIPARVAKLRALGNAIDPRPAAVFIKAAM